MRKHFGTERYEHVSPKTGRSFSLRTFCDMIFGGMCAVVSVDRSPSV